jgi:hypothetical protein
MFASGELSVKSLGASLARSVTPSACSAQPRLSHQDIDAFADYRSLAKRGFLSFIARC